MLEKMGVFFENRLSGYDAHMMQNIEGATEFYPFTARMLPCHPFAEVLDLGCGTGLELEFYFALCDTARVTGIDLSRGMLDALREKFKGRELILHHGSYFDLPLGKNAYDAAVSVESLHHFTKDEKLPLYRKLHAALREGGYFILTDYFAENDAEERHFRAELLRLTREEGLPEGVCYHYDTPLTVAHEIEALTAAGFSRVEVLKNWGATYTVKAVK